VYGDSLQSNLVAVVVPDKPVIEKWALDIFSSTSYEDILGSPELQTLLMNEIKTKCREAGFFGFEIPQRIHITSTLFSVDNDLLTPTFKLKRNEAKQFFLKEIKSMYGGAVLQGENN
jgi:long-chain acyl-CoA synthetase